MDKAMEACGFTAYRLSRLIRTLSLTPSPPIEIGMLEATNTTGMTAKKTPYGTLRFSAAPNSM